MSNKEGPGGFRKRKHDNFPHSQRREGKDVNASSPVMVAFKAFQQELDARHDKYERLVKLSRDITVESKRIIFLLHRITSAPDMEEILTEAEIKLDGVRQKILQVAQELLGEEMHQFHRAITTGLQEYVEAVSFQHFIKTRSLISMDEINKQLVFTTEDNGKENQTDPQGVVPGLAPRPRPTPPQFIGIPRVARAPSSGYVRPGRTVPVIAFQREKESVSASHVSASVASAQPHPASRSLTRPTGAVSLIFISVLSGAGIPGTVMGRTKTYGKISLRSSNSQFQSRCAFLKPFLWQNAK
ncbi:translin-associated protein X isoform X1 [Eptesicus fuscus]|uniref:translin-associated protein X isoform X1 n=1 Tax=Eptesicus fuscus TaxID=29078 RepID=UPI002403C02F|nr:translin-associated protein X isoform X1 [Eptesicus fuscus]